MKFREDQINQIIDKTALMTKQQKRAVVLNKSDNFNIAATCWMYFRELFSKGISFVNLIFC